MLSQTPGLAVVLVGERKDSQTYVRNKKKACEEVRTHAPWWAFLWWQAVQGARATSSWVGRWPPGQSKRGVGGGSFGELVTRPGQHCGPGTQSIQPCLPNNPLPP